MRYQCMGSWFAVRSGIGYTYAAVADTVEQDTREKFKCLVINILISSVHRDHYQVLMNHCCISYRWKYTLYDKNPSTCSWRIINLNNKHLHCFDLSYRWHWKTRKMPTIRSDGSCLAFPTAQVWVAFTGVHSN